MSEQVLRGAIGVQRANCHIGHTCINFGPCSVWTSNFSCGQENVPFLLVPKQENFCFELVPFDKILFLDVPNVPFYHSQMYFQINRGRAEGWLLASELHLTLPPHPNLRSQKLQKVFIQSVPIYEKHVETLISRFCSNMNNISRNHSIT